ncbi:MAG: hypothetical protein P8H35_00425 [Flavobacteriales bacterium]|nr:hypothetical protein [Flavobacteriales bacterium]
MRTTYTHKCTKGDNELDSYEVKLNNLSESLDGNSSNREIASEIINQTYNIGQVNQANLYCYSSPRDVNEQLKEIQKNLETIARLLA